MAKVANRYLRTDPWKLVEEGLNPWDMAAGGLVATEAGARLEIHPGVGGSDCVVCAPADGFDTFLGLVSRAGFLAAKSLS